MHLRCKYTWKLYQKCNHVGTSIYISKYWAHTAKALIHSPAHTHTRMYTTAIVWKLKLMVEFGNERMRMEMGWGTENVQCSLQGFVWILMMFLMDNFRRVSLSQNSMKLFDPNKMPNFGCLLAWTLNEHDPAPISFVQISLEPLAKLLTISGYK